MQSSDILCEVGWSHALGSVGGEIYMARIKTNYWIKTTMFFRWINANGSENKANRLLYYFEYIVVKVEPKYIYIPNNIGTFENSSV